MKSTFTTALLVGALIGGTAVAAQAQQRATAQAMAVPTWCWSCWDQWGSQTSECNWVMVGDFGQSSTQCNTEYGPNGSQCVPLGTLCGSPFSMSIEGSATQPILQLALSAAEVADGVIRDCQGRILGRQATTLELSSAIPTQLLL